MKREGAEAKKCQAEAARGRDKKYYNFLARGKRLEGREAKEEAVETAMMTRKNKNTSQGNP